MRLVNRFWAIFVIATKRILSQPWMALATVMGMIFAISLSMSVPLYASSVYNRVFLQEVGVEEGEAASRATRSSHPPFAFLYNYDSNSGGNLEWQDLETVDQYLMTQSERMLGLPVTMKVRYLYTNPLALFPSGVKEFTNDQKPLLWSSLSFISDLQDHVTIIEGAFPKVSESGPIEVMVLDTLASNLGLQVGEEYALFARNQLRDGGRTTVAVPVKIVGVYQPRDLDEEFWFIRPELLRDRLMVAEEAYASQVAPMLSDEVYGAFWYLLADGSTVRPEQAMTLAGRIQAYQRQAEQALPNIRLGISPVKALFAYQSAANLLTILLIAFSVPIFGLLLAFITMTAGMTVERQRNEIAVLRSRGAEVGQMVGMASVESLLLGMIAIAASLPLSAGITMAIGHTRSFLDFSSPTSLQIHWTPTSIYFGIGAILLTMLARLFPTIRAARDNIVVYKRDRARSLRAPVWQRMWLDVLLMIPAGYGIYLLRQQGSIDAFNASRTGDPFSNPLLMMVPALAIFAFSLLFLRLMPLFMRVITWVSSRTKSVGMMMAARHLARTPSTYTLPLVLLILTLSLSAFTATLAGTLDNHLHDQIYYQHGADVNFMDLGDSPNDDQGRAPAAARSASSAFTNAETQPGWFFIPVTEYVRVPGVKDATRVGRYPATVMFSSGSIPAEVMGVDRYNLPNVAFWRSDFSSESLGELMNRLAAKPNGILVPADFLAENTLAMNDLVTLRVINYEKTTEIDFQVAGTFNLWPTYYPGEESKPLFIANLDYIFEAAGGQFPYSVWLKADAPDVKRMSRDSIVLTGARTIDWNEPVSKITGEQSRPERQGLFGVLSVGFTAAALLTVLGFLLYALLSYQRRFVELGVLRAIGLSAGQMTIFLAAELAFLIVMGGLIGTVLGVWISNMFIPYLQIGGDPASQIPPYVVYVAWPAILRVYALFGMLFVVALGTLVVLLRRMRIFEAVKMGETV